MVEDDPLLALPIAEMLKDAGLTAIGPAGNVTGAFALVGHANHTFAILDINLRQETSETVELGLQRLGAPFLCVSGYSDGQSPDTFVDAPFLSEPC